MDRELLLEIGCEELPAAWLPALTGQLESIVDSELRALRLSAESPIEPYTTPRRLTVRVARLAERQTDLEELVNGPPVSAAFGSDGTPTPAAVGFATRQGVAVSALERVETPRGVYLACRRKQRGRAAVDVLPQVLGSTLRRLTFPRLMRWDARLEDGRGELQFGRPIRWILFVYGGRVVPFVIGRVPAAESPAVQEVASGAVTYGHRFLTTSGRPGRAIKVRSFDEYRARLLENFVILERAERHEKIVRALDAKARRLQGRVSRAAHGGSGLLAEVPDLVEYPSVVAGTFGPEFLDLPDEVLTTTLIRHQRYFPVESETGRLKNAFLAVINTEPDNERTIARNAERVVTARLRDAHFFWTADRRVPLASRLDRLATLLFHEKLGTYREKAERMARLARWIAAEAFSAGDDAAAHAEQAARLAKADLTTDMVREFPDLQGTMGGIYARGEGLPVQVWKAIYYHYLPIGVEADAPPSRDELGAAAVTWAAVSLADKLDTICGLFAAGERPTGSRDPYALRRAAQGVVRLLADLRELSGIVRPLALGPLVGAAMAGFDAARPAGGSAPGPDPIAAFFAERLEHLLKARGSAPDEVSAVAHRARTGLGDQVPALLRRRAAALAEARRAPEFEELAELFKRVQHISRGVAFPAGGWAGLTEFARTASREPAERELVQHVAGSVAALREAEDRGDHVAALKRIAGFRPYVARYFDEVLVMADDPGLRDARLRLMAGLRDLVMQIADISCIVPGAAAPAPRASQDRPTERD
jgi:glycyl-tRNA synthetase beta chain